MEGETEHKKLTRVRPPQVQAAYELEEGSAMESEQLPFDLPALPNGSQLSEPEQLSQQIRLFREQMESRSAMEAWRSSEDRTGTAQPGQQERLNADQQGIKGEEGETE